MLSDREQQIRRIKEKLADIRDYKRLLAETGDRPDDDDKKRESELIIQLLRLEKGLTPKAKPKARADGSIPSGRRPVKKKARRH